MDGNRIIQNIFKSCFPAFDPSSLPLKDIQAAQAIMQCRTPALGYRTYRCPNAHEEKQLYHSCRHRSCPLCAEKARHDWVERQRQRLLDCAHYHVIFTLPHEYLPLWHYNRAWFTHTFFQICRDTLMTLLADERYLGATPGVLMALHTWGRQLNCHPHIHCLVTAGGLTTAGVWKHSEGDFLLPVRVVKSLYRGKLQAAIKVALEDGTLICPGQTSMGELLQTHRALYQKQWSVRIQEQYAHGRGVMLYLARYVKGSPFHPQQIVYCDSHRMVFRYRDHRDQKSKTLSLPMHEFLRRLLWHVPVPGRHVVRHYGLYASACWDRRNACREALGGEREADAATAPSEQNPWEWYCRTCGQALRYVYTVTPGRTKENSIHKVPADGFVQQHAHAEHRIRGPDTQSGRYLH
jgi:hypothetical protein